MKNILPIFGTIIMVIALAALFCGGEEVEKENWCEACCNNVWDITSDEELCGMMGQGYPCDLQDWFDGCVDFCEGEDEYDDQGNVTMYNDPWSDDAKDCVYSADCVNSSECENSLEACIQEYPEISDGGGGGDDNSGRCTNVCQILDNCALLPAITVEQCVQDCVQNMPNDGLDCIEQAADCGEITANCADYYK